MFMVVPATVAVPEPRKRPYVEALVTSKARLVPVNVIAPAKVMGFVPSETLLVKSIGPVHTPDPAAVTGRVKELMNAELFVMSPAT